MAVRISTGTSQPSDTLEVMVDLPEPEEGPAKAPRSHDGAQAVKDTSESSECLRRHRWHNISEILREAGIHE